MPSPAFTQVAFRVRQDNGSETTASWYAAQNVNYAVSANANFRVRFGIDENNSYAWTSVVWNLYYSKNGAAYAAVTASTPVKFSLSGNFTDGANTTSQITGMTGTFVSTNAGMKETTGGATNSGTKNYYFDTEWCLQLDSTQMNPGDYVDLEIYNGTSPIGTYTKIPRVFVINALTSKDIASGIPAVDKPACTSVAPPVALTSKAITSGIPVVDKSTLGQKQALTSKAIASGIPAVDKATLKQIQALVSKAITSGIPAVSKPTINQVVPMVSKAITSGIPSVSKSTLGQKHALTSKAITSGIPLVDKPAAGDVGPGSDNLASKNIASGIPVVGKPTAGTGSTTVSLTSKDIASGILAVSKPSIGQKHALISRNNETTPVVGQPTISQVQTLIAFYVVAGIPLVDKPDFISRPPRTSPTKNLIRVENLNPAFGISWKTAAADEILSISSDRRVHVNVDD